MKLKHFKGCKTIDEAKLLFRELSKKHHPDKPGGDVKIMQEINEEYQFIEGNGLVQETPKLKLQFEGFEFEIDAKGKATQQELDLVMERFDGYLKKQNPLLRIMLRAALEVYLIQYKQ